MSETMSGTGVASVQITGRQVAPEADDLGAVPDVVPAAGQPLDALDRHPHVVGRALDRGQPAGEPDERGVEPRR